MSSGRLKDACDVDVAPRSKITSAISTKFRPVLHFTSAYISLFLTQFLIFITSGPVSPPLDFADLSISHSHAQNQLYGTLKTFTLCRNYERGTAFTTTFRTVYRFRPNSRGGPLYYYLVCFFVLLQRSDYVSGNQTSVRPTVRPLDDR